ncbi:MAG: IPT/TIG domain-containing protein [Ignavibacteria bacterium]|nr:IPT/TIG domain-containing protein [Ignavibacteria bacterium]
MKFRYIVLLFCTLTFSFFTSTFAANTGLKSPYDLSAAAFSVSMATAAGPTIANFNPTSGSPGTVVTITGSGFSDVVSTRFGGAAASFIIDSDMQVRATVPPDGLTGQISMTNSLGGVGTSSGTFTVSPRITSFAPTGGAPGALVNIFGANFTGASSVKFNGTEAASFLVMSTVQIRATVPNGATTGPISVTNQGGTGTSASNFVVVPFITGFTPTADTIGKMVMITGMNFTGATGVKFNGTSAPFVINSSTEIDAKVPRGATTGKISVTNSAGTGTSTDSFTVFRGGGIGDLVWNDLDSSGSFDPGEPGFAGVTVNLQEAGNDGILGNGDDVIYSPATTDANGNYTFDDLPGGLYRIDVDESTLPGAFALSSGTEPLDLTLNTGQKYLGADFGYHEITSRICVKKYFDANHNQQLDSGEVPMAGVKFHLTGTSNTFSGMTDTSGLVCFDQLPIDTYQLTEDVPSGYAISSPPSGVMTFVTQGGEDTTAVWLNGAAEDTVKYRTAAMLEWATATDAKGKLKPIKCKPDKVDFKFLIQAPRKANAVTLKFSMFTRGKIYSDSTKLLQVFSWDSLKEVTFTPGSSIDSGRIFQVDGRGFKGKQVKVTLVWATTPKTTTVKIGDQDFRLNMPRLPMPNLLNICQDLEPQQVFGILVGIDPHSVVIKNCKELVKTLNAKGILHTGTASCLDSLDNGKPITKRQNGLPPTKMNNKLFAEALTFYLNIIASTFDKFPRGWRGLIYDNHIDQTDPTNPTFDGKDLERITDAVQFFMGCSTNSQGIVATPEEYYKVLKKINESFSGPIDTFHWSCEKIRLTGVRALKDVPFLRANPGAIEPTVPPLQQAWTVIEPMEYRLDQNYPNPFNPTTTIQFELPDPAIVTLKVFNLLGQEVATLLDHESMDDGRQDVEFDAATLASGVYFYRLVAEGVGDPDEGISGRTFVSLKKMLLLK